MISCNALFSFFKPSSNATAFPPHRLWRKPLTNTPRHRENFSTGTPKSSSASAPQSDDTAATLPNPMRQNAGPILALAGFKRVISVFKYQEFMPDPSDIAMTLRNLRQHKCVKMRCKFLFLMDLNACLARLNVKNLCLVS